MRETEEEREKEQHLYVGGNRENAHLSQARAASSGSA